MLLHYLKITFHNILNNKFRYLLTTLGIAVGMVIFSIMFFFADGFNDKWNKMPNEEQLAVFKYTTTDANGNTSSSNIAINSNKLKNVLSEPLPNVEAIGIKGYGAISYISEENKPEFTYKTKVMVTNKAFIELAGIRFVKGGISDNWEVQNMALIDEGLATKLFGSVDAAVGKRLEKRFSDNTLDKVYSISGVIKKVYSPMYGADMYTTLNPEERHYVQSFVRFKKGSDMQEYNAHIKALTTENKGGIDEFLQLVPYAELNKNTVLYIGLLLMGSLVLVVALMNFANLLLASMQLRIRQFTLRKIVGAKSGTFMLMVLCEILPILIASTFLCYLMMELLLNEYQSSTNIPLRIREEVDGFIPLIVSYPIKIAGWTLLGCILLAGILVRRIQKSITTQGIHGQFLKANKNIARNFLMFFQLMFTLIFLNVSVFLYQYTRNAIPEVFQSVSKKQSEAMLVVPLYQLKLLDKFDEINNRIKSISGVLGTTDKYKSIEGVKSYEIISLEKKEISVVACTKFEGYDTFWETKDPIFKRNLAPDEVIINKALAQEMTNDSLSTFTLYNKSYKVVGVVDAIPCTDSKENVILGNAEVWYEKLCLVKCTPARTKEVKKEILKIIREYLPETIDYNINSLYDEFNMQSRIMQVMLVAVVVATLFSIIITMLGVYTAVSYDTKRKRKEIAIRKINGATRKDIAKQFARLYTVLLVLSGVLGGLLYRFIILGLFDMTSDGFTTKLTIEKDLMLLMLVVLIVALTIFAQIQKAVSENPAEVIKSE